MYPRSVRALPADALLVSALQRSDELNASQIWRAVAVALDAYGGAGCAERVAQGFEGHLGDRSRPDAVGSCHGGDPGRIIRSRGHGRWPRSTTPPWAGTRRRDFRRSGRHNPLPRASKGSRNGR
jgi:hypothetical protein